jgi:hypothetical protein
LQQETFSRERKRTNESVCEAGARQIVAEVLARQIGDDQLAEMNKNAAIEERKRVNKLFKNIKNRLVIKNKNAAISIGERKNT